MWWCFSNSLLQIWCLGISIQDPSLSIRDHVLLVRHLSLSNLNNVLFGSLKCQFIKTWLSNQKYHSRSSLNNQKYCLWSNGKQKKNHTIGAVRKSNWKIVERGKIDALSTHVYGHACSCLGTATSVANGRVKLVLRVQTSTVSEKVQQKQKRQIHIYNRVFLISCEPIPISTEHLTRHKSGSVFKT
jgi:hypothetical protein